VLLVSILHVTMCSIVISAGIAVFTLVVHWHSVGMGVRASMVDAYGIVERCVVLACVLLPVNSSIN